MAIKYIRARLPGREPIHLVPTDGLSLNALFGEDLYVEGWARALCNQKGKGWIWGSGQGLACERCARKR